MAISQDRMMAVIQDGRKAEKAYQSLRASIDSWLERASGQELSLLEAIQGIEQTLRSSPEELSIPALAYEELHFSRNAGKNERMKLYLRQKREKAGIFPRAPDHSPQAPQHSPTQPRNFSHLQDGETYIPLPYKQAPAPLQKLSLTDINDALKRVPPPSGHVPLTPKPAPQAAQTLVVTSDPDIERDLSEKEPDILAPLPSVF